MRTPIGGEFRRSQRRLTAGCGLAVTVVLVDFGAIAWLGWSERVDSRWALALAALALHVWLVDGDLASAGLVFRPLQGWRYWLKATFWIGLAVAALIAAGLGAVVLLGYKLPVYTTPPAATGGRLFQACVCAPLLEETLYRLVLCSPLVVALGAWPAIAISGIAFGALHMLYGNPSPENLCGGWFLAWAYLQSGTVVVPLLLHSLGNLLVVASQVAAWYWLNTT
jgi:membrane protease YdiL (CAAX protease family)